MAEHKVYLHSVGPWLYDDTVSLGDADFDDGLRSALATTGQLWVEEAPSTDYHVMRLVDMVGVYVTYSLFDAHTILYATTDDTPVALTVNEQTVVGRLTGGNIDDIAIGIADNNIVQIDDADAADDDYAKFTASGLEGRSYAEVADDIQSEIDHGSIAGLADDDHTHYSLRNKGIISGCLVTDAGGLTVDWTGGYIYDYDNTAVRTISSASAQAVTNNSVNYVYFDPGVSTTVLQISTTRPTDSDQVLVATVCAQDDDIVGILDENVIGERIGKIETSLSEMFPTIVISGGIVSAYTADATSDLDVVMDAMVFIAGAQERYEVAAINSEDTAMRTHYHDAADAWDSGSANTVDTSNYDDPTDGAGLIAIPANKWVKGMFYYSLGVLNYVYPTTYYTNEAQALSAAPPTVPPGMARCVPLTAIIFQQGETDISNATFEDIRPGIGQIIPTSVTDHGSLAGLSDDDHPQYIKDSEFTQDSGVLVGTGAGTFQEETGDTLRTSLGLAIGTDVLAQQTIGIADDNLLEVDGSPNSGEYARFTASGLEGRTEAEFKADFNLEIGTDVLAYDAGIQNLAGVAMAADKFYYTTADDTHAAASVTAFARSILDDVDEATFKATVNLEIGTDVLAYDAGLADLATVAMVADRFYYTTADNTHAAAAVTAFARSILDDADEATFKATVNLEIGTDVQAYDAELAALAGLASAANKIPYFTAAETADMLDFKDEDDMASDSATALASQQSIKAYADSLISGGGYLKADGTVPLTADWDIGDGLMIQADKIRARDGDGLYLVEDGGNGLFVADGGNVQVTAGNLYLNAATTQDRSIEVGYGRTGNGNAYIDLIGDATYTDYGLRIIRKNTGANAASYINHRGTGALVIQTVDAGEISFYTNLVKRVGISAASGDLRIYGEDDTYSGLHFYKATLDVDHINWSLSHRDDNTDLWIYSYDGTTYKTWLKFDYDGGIYINDEAATGIYFQIDASTKMTLDSTYLTMYTYFATNDQGNGEGRYVWYDKAKDDYLTMEINGSYVYFAEGALNAVSNYFLWAHNNGTVGVANELYVEGMSSGGGSDVYIDLTTNIGRLEYISSSKYLKDIYADLSETITKEQILSISPKIYRWKNSDRWKDWQNGNVNIGFIADEVAEVMPGISWKYKVLIEKETGLPVDDYMGNRGKALYESDPDKYEIKDSWGYNPSQLGIYHHVVLQTHNKELQELRERVNELERKLAV